MKRNLQTEDWKKLLLENVEVFGNEKLCDECRIKKTEGKDETMDSSNITEHTVLSETDQGTSNDRPVCIFCGYFPTDAYNIYERKTMEIVTKWSSKHGRTKLISTAIEDTYMPILQVRKIVFLRVHLLKFCVNETAVVTYVPKTVINYKTRSHAK